MFQYLTNTYGIWLVICADFVHLGFPFPGTGMLSGGAEESTEKTSQSFQGQKVNLHCVYMEMGVC